MSVLFATERHSAIPEINTLWIDTKNNRYLVKKTTPTNVYCKRNGVLVKKSLGVWVEQMKKIEDIEELWNEN